MKTSEILTKIKNLLGTENEEICLSQMKLKDGITIVESESFAAGDEILIVTEDGKVALPVGEYTLDDDRVLIVREEGVIAEVKEAKKEEDIEEVVEPDIDEEVETSEDVKSAKKVVKSISEETYFAKVEELQTEIETLKKANEELKLSIEKNKVIVEVEEKKTDLTENKTEVEDVKPIVHNPENKTEVEGFKYGQNGMVTTLDRVMEKLSK